MERIVCLFVSSDCRMQAMRLTERVAEIRSKNSHLNPEIIGNITQGTILMIRDMTPDEVVFEKEQDSIRVVSSG